MAYRGVSYFKRWYAKTDKADYHIYDRIRETTSGEDPSLVHFNGATQRSFHAPPCVWESIYCYREPTPSECKYRGLDLVKGLYKYDPEDEEESAFELRPAKEEGKEVGNGATAVNAKVDTPEVSYIMPTHIDIAVSFELSDDSTYGG